MHFYSTIKWFVIWLYVYVKIKKLELDNLKLRRKKLQKLEKKKDANFKTKHSKFRRRKNPEQKSFVASLRL